jgi:hypothetical protein
LSVETDFRFLGADVQSMRKNSYVNDLGRFFGIAVRLYKKGGFRNLTIEAADLLFGSSTTEARANFEKATDIAAKLPVISVQETTNGGITYFRLDDTKKVYNFLYTGTFASGNLQDYKKRYKDNREITSETIQFHFRKSANAFFTDKFLEYSPFIYTGTSTISFKIAYSTTLTYNNLDTNYKGTLVNNNVDIKITILDNQIYLENTTAGTTWWNANATSMVSWAICDADGKIILARNGNLTQRLFLNSSTIV